MGVWGEGEGCDEDQMAADKLLRKVRAVVPSPTDRVEVPIHLGWKLLITHLAKQKLIFVFSHLIVQIFMPMIMFMIKPYFNHFRKWQVRLWMYASTKENQVNLICASIKINRHQSTKTERDRDESNGIDAKKSKKLASIKIWKSWQARSGTSSRVSSCRS